MAAARSVAAAHVLVIGITGPSRAGKTVLSRAIREALPGEESWLLRQDDFAGELVNGPKTTDWQALKRELLGMVRAASAVASAAAPMVVVAEGWLLFADEDVAALCGLRIELEVSHATCLKRRWAAAHERIWERSLLEKDPSGRALEDKDARMWAAYLQYGGVGAYNSGDGVTVVRINGELAPSEVFARALSAARRVLDDLMRIKA